MRRILTILCIFLLLAIPAGSMLSLSSQLGQHADDVKITETTVFGDRSEAGGITVDLWTEYRDASFWNTHVVTGEAMETVTTFYPSSPFEEETTSLKVPKFGITLRDSIGYDYGDGVIPGTQNGLNDAFDALAAEILPGESKEKKITLADYMEYYALQVDITVPSDDLLGYDEILATSRVIKDEKAASSWLSNLEPGSDQYVAQQFQEFFRIPVLQTEKIKIGLDKNRSGEIGGTSYGNDESEMANLYSQFDIMTEDAIYFTFRGHGTAGTLYDFSQVPGGYGIYKLPYSRADGVDASQLSMVYSLDPTIEILAMELSPDQSDILLHTLESGTYRMTVIDLDTMTAKQYIETLHDMEFTYAWDSWQGDDFMVIQYSDRLMVFSITGDGSYQLDFAAQLPESDDEGWRWPDASDVMIYDGERLVVAGELLGTDVRDAFCLTVYNRDGIAYHGAYKTSFNPEEVDSYSWSCNLLYENPLRLSWN